MLSDFRKAGITQPRDSVELMRYVDQLLSTFTVPTDMQLLKRFEPEDQQAKTMLVDPLSQRELEVLRLFKTELSGPEIAQQLMIALSTVRIYTKSI